jgi:hypothetical protein
MQEFVAIIAGFFLMISALACVFLFVGYLVGIEPVVLAPYGRIAGVVLALSVLIGLYDQRVFQNARQWLGVW